MNRAVIGVGSNIEPDANIAAARRRIARAHKLLAESQFVETEPIGYDDQPNFINGVILVETDMDRETLKGWLGGVETDLGRVRSENRCGPRTIDLDIVVWNGSVVDEDVYVRPFLREAVLQVWPELDVE